MRYGSAELPFEGRTVLVRGYLQTGDPVVWEGGTWAIWTVELKAAVVAYEDRGREGGVGMSGWRTRCMPGAKRRGRPNTCTSM